MCAGDRARAQTLHEPGGGACLEEVPVDQSKQHHHVGGFEESMREEGAQKRTCIVIFELFDAQR